MTELPTVDNLDDVMMVVSRLRAGADRPLAEHRAAERQMAMWRLAAEEIREFVNEALARHPEARQH